MYSPFQLAIKFLRHYSRASNGKGHGVHSPFVFDFVKHVLTDRTHYPTYEKIEALRAELLGDKSVIEVKDLGAGSAVIPTRMRRVDRIAASSLKPKKFAQLLHRMVRYYKPSRIVELGTSFGTSTAYLATGNTAAAVYTLEGAPSIAAKARETFSKLKLTNVELLEGDFAQSLPVLLKKLGRVDLAFVDGNHRSDPTLQYYHWLLPNMSFEGMILFDDIHWSAEMESAWEQIKAEPSVTLTIDLFFIGLVFINPDFKVKQHFKIRF